MDGIPIPPHVVGRVGLVAQLQRVQADQVGKLVLVRKPVGPMSSLANSVKPVFAWQVMVLGEPVELNSRACRDIIVADACLKPVSQLDPAEGDALAKRQAEQEFSEALKDLRRILDANPLSPEELDTFVEKAAEQFGMERLLEVVPVAVALRELDFRPVGDDDGGLQWSGMHLGSELHVFAGPDMFGRWMLMGRNLSRRHAMFDERILPAQEARGKVMLKVLDLWREAFGREAPVPDLLAPAVQYQQHQHDMASLRIGMPTLCVDGEVFRATRRWIAQRLGPTQTSDGETQSEMALQLSFGDGLLRLEAPGLVFACPANGVWVGDCAVPVRAVLALPSARLRGWHVAFERSADRLTVNGMHLDLMPAM